MLMAEMLPVTLHLSKRRCCRVVTADKISRSPGLWKLESCRLWLLLCKNAMQYGIEPNIGLKIAHKAKQGSYLCKCESSFTRYIIYTRSLQNLWNRRYLGKHHVFRENRIFFIFHVFAVSSNQNVHPLQVLSLLVCHPCTVIILNMAPFFLISLTSTNPSEKVNRWVSKIPSMNG